MSEAHKQKKKINDGKMLTVLAIVVHFYELKERGNTATLNSPFVDDPGSKVADVLLSASSCVTTGGATNSNTVTKKGGNSEKNFPRCSCKQAVGIKRKLEMKEEWVKELSAKLPAFATSAF